MTNDLPARLRCWPYAVEAIASFAPGPIIKIDVLRWDCEEAADEIEKMKKFIESISEASGPYPDLDGHRIVADARAVLAKHKEKHHEE